MSWAFQPLLGAAQLLGSPPDTTAPSLSSASASANSHVSYTGAVTTDEGNGTLYYYISANSSETAATVKASGASQAVTTSGVQNVSGSGLTPATGYYLHFVHTDAAANDSTVLSTSQFFTPSHLYFRSTQANGITSGGVACYDLLTTQGSTLDTAVVTATASGTDIQWTKTAGGSILVFATGRVPSGGWTITQADIAAWVKESLATVNAGARARFYKWSSGTETLIAGGPFDDGVEFTTTDAEYTWLADVTDTALAEDDRLIVKLYLTNVGTMADGTVTLRFNGGASASLSGNQTASTSAVNLTSYGAEDAHSYDSGGTAIRKTGGGSLITVTGYDYGIPASQAYSGTTGGFLSRQVTTTDFTASNITNKADCVFMSMVNTASKGVRITAPAGLETRTLTLILAHAMATGQTENVNIIATVSGADAPTPVTLNPTVTPGSGDEITVEFTYSAGEAGQTITVDYYPDASATSGTRYIGYRGAHVSPIGDTVSTSDSFVNVYPAVTFKAEDSGVTGTGSTSQAQTASGSGTHTVAAVTGTGATSQAQTSAGTGTHTPAAVTATGSTSQAQTAAGSGSYTLPAITGTGATSQAQTSDGAGTHTIGTVDGTGATSQAQTASGSGTHTVAAVSGTGSTAQAQTASGSGLFGSGVDGTGTTSQAQTSDGSGTFTLAAVTGSGSTSQAQTSSGSGSHTIATVTGTGSTSQAQTADGSGLFTAAGVVNGTGSTSQAQTSDGSGVHVAPVAPVSEIRGGGIDHQIKRRKATLSDKPNQHLDQIIAKAFKTVFGELTDKKASKTVQKQANKIVSEYTEEYRPKFDEIDWFAFNQDLEAVQRLFALYQREIADARQTAENKRIFDIIENDNLEFLLMH